MQALGAGFGRVVCTICGRWVPVIPNQCFLTIFYLINKYRNMNGHRNSLSAHTAGRGVVSRNVCGLSDCLFHILQTKL